MQLEPSVSFPSSFEAREARAAAPDSARHALRLILGAWAGIVYLIYWLGYVGVLSTR